MSLSKKLILISKEVRQLSTIQCSSQFQKWWLNVGFQYDSTLAKQNTEDKDIPSDSDSK